MAPAVGRIAAALIDGCPNRPRSACNRAEAGESLQADGALHSKHWNGDRVSVVILPVFASFNEGGSNTADGGCHLELVTARTSHGVKPVYRCPVVYRSPVRRHVVHADEACGCVRNL